MQWLECTVPGGDDPEELCNALAALGVTVRYAPVALWQKALVRHDPAALAAALERTGSLLDKSVCAALPDTETVCGTASAGADAAIWVFAPGLEE